MNLLILPTLALVLVMLQARNAILYVSSLTPSALRPVTPSLCSLFLFFGPISVLALGKVNAPTSGTTIKVPMKSYL